MGIKSMRFLNMEGDTIVVSFSGDNVSAGELIPAESPVTLQMDGGGGEYKAVKYTTASISIVCDGLQHLDLYTAEPLDVKVLVYNDTTDTTLFFGYVSPNTFNQTVTGINDTLTIECVDCLGIAKFVPYDIGVDKVLTLAELIEDISSRLFLGKWYISRSVILRSGDAAKETRSYDKLTLATRSFYEDINPEKIHASLSDEPGFITGTVASLLPKAATIFDVLSSIAESFRFYFIQCGDTLYLLDEVVTREKGYCEFIAKRDPVVTLGGQKAIEESHFSASDSQVSLLPRYSMFSLERKEVKEMQILPSIFGNELLNDKGEEWEYHDNQGTTSEKKTVVVGLRSDVCAVESNAGFYAYAELVPPKNKAYSKAWEIAAWGDEHGWVNYYRLPHNDDGSGLSKLALSILPEFVTALPRREALGLRLNMTVAFSDSTARMYPHSLITGGDYRVLGALKSTLPDGRVLYYNEFSESWEEQKRLIEFLFTSSINNSAEWRESFIVASFPDGSEFPSRYPVGDVLAAEIPGGKIEFELYANAAGYGIPKVCYIKELSLQVVVTPEIRAANTADNPGEVEVLGTFSYSNALEPVTLPFDVRSTLSKKFFGTEIDGVEFLTSRAPGATLLESKRWEVKLLFDDGNNGVVDMLGRICLLSKCGDGMEYELHLTDEHNSASSPLLRLTSLAWQGGKIIAGYIKDVRNSEIRVTLN